MGVFRLVSKTYNLNSIFLSQAQKRLKYHIKPIAKKMESDQVPGNKEIVQQKNEKLQDLLSAPFILGNKLEERPGGKFCAENQR